MTYDSGYTYTVSITVPVTLGMTVRAGNATLARAIVTDAARARFRAFGVPFQPLAATYSTCRHTIYEESRTWDNDQLPEYVI